MNNNRFIWIINLFAVCIVSFAMLLNILTDRNYYWFIIQIPLIIANGYFFIHYHKLKQKG